MNKRLPCLFFIRRNCISKSIAYIHILASRVQSPLSRAKAQHPGSSVQSPAFRVQRSESSVQSPASRVQRPESSIQSPASNSCVQSPEILVSTFFCMFRSCQFFRVTFFSRCAFFMLHFFRITLFFVALWSSCLFFHVKLFHIAISRVAGFRCCTFFFAWHSFQVAIFPRRTFFILYSLHVAPFCALHLFHVALFSCCTHFLLNSFSC